MGARTTLVGMVIAALMPATVRATIPRPVPIAPKDQASLPVGETPTFKVRSSGHGMVFVHVSKWSRRGRDGVIGDDGLIAEARRKGRYYVVKPKFFDYPGYWANQKGKWYWQAYRIACGEEPRSSDCKVEGAVRSFRLR